MKVEKHGEIEKKLIERQVIRFDKKDIEEMIIEKIEAEGYETKGCAVIFNTKWKYVEDEWGMNRRPVSEFLDIQVNL